MCVATGSLPPDFSTAYEVAARRLFAGIDRACALDAHWPRRVYAALGEALELFAAEPELGRLLVFEAYAAGVDAQNRHEATLERLAELLRCGREEASISEVPDDLEEGLIGSLSFLIGRMLRAGEADRLLGLGPELTAFVLTPYIGREEAARVAARGGS